MSLLITRDQRATEIVQSLESSGAVRLAPTGLDAIERSQGRSVAYGDFAYALAEQLRTRGFFTPELDAPNRSAARLEPANRVWKAWTLILRKRRLQREQRYRWLWVRKSTLEFPLMIRRLAKSRLIRRYARAVVSWKTPAPGGVAQLDEFD